MSANELDKSVHFLGNLFQCYSDYYMRHLPFSQILIQRYSPPVALEVQVPLGGSIEVFILRLGEMLCCSPANPKHLQAMDLHLNRFTQ